MTVMSKNEYSLNMNLHSNNFEKYDEKNKKTKLKNSQQLTNFQRSINKICETILGNTV